MLKASDMQGVYAIIPTPARPGAQSPLACDTVDLEETQRLVDALIDSGVSGIIALGTTGECATLSTPDYDTFVHGLLDAIGGRVPAFIGATAPGTQEVVRRMRLLNDRGCAGTLLGPPMWQPPTDAVAVDFYAGISAAFPKISIMVYTNERVFRYGFGEAFWRGVVAQAPTVTAAKYLRPANLKALLDIVGTQVQLLPSDMTVDHFHAVSPQTTTACWSTAASMGPEPVLKLMRAVAAGGRAAITRQAAGIAWTNEPLHSLLSDKDLFASHNIQIEKVRIEAAGYCRPGPIRPPYNHMPAAVREASLECGRRWKSLRQGDWAPASSA